MGKTVLAILAGVLLAAAAYQGWERYQRGIPAHDRAKWSMNSGDYRGALAHLIKAQEQDPADMRVVVDMAECFDRLGDKATAASLYRQAEPLLMSSSAPTGMRYHRERYEVLTSLGY